MTFVGECAYCSACDINRIDGLEVSWRRFQIRTELGPPSRAQATRFLERLAERLGGDLGLAPCTLADKLAGASFAELEEFALDVRRRAVLELPDDNIRRIVLERLEHRRGQAAG